MMLQLCGLFSSTGIEVTRSVPPLLLRQQSSKPVGDRHGAD